jgi:hypothetical protein
MVPSLAPASPTAFVTQHSNPQLHDLLKDATTALLATAATLERSYLEALNADKSPEWRLQMNGLNKLHRKWVADLEHFRLCFEEIGRSEEDSGQLR